MKVVTFFSLSLIGLMALVSGLSAKHHEGDDLRDFGAKLKQAVQEGKLSKEDAMAKWKAAAQKMQGEHHEKGDRHGDHGKKDWGHRGHDKKDRHDGHDSHSDLKEYGEKLKHAVEEGKLSKEDAMAKWKAAAQKMKGEHHGKGGHEDHKSKMMEAIKRAVEQGKLSEREAKAKWMAIRGEHG